MKRSLVYLVGIVCLLSVAYGIDTLTPKVPFVPPPSEATAATYVNELFGYGWSSDAGWISFNCATGGNSGGNICGTRDYKVRVTTNDQGASMPLDGYAWSAHIGWINFNANYSTCPNGSSVAACRPRIEEDGAGGWDLKGWARACSVFVTGCTGALKPSLGGWDGWISLSSLNGGGGTYGLKVRGRNPSYFRGDAWGADVVGRLSLSCRTGGPAGGDVCAQSNYEVTFTPPCASTPQYSCSADGSQSIETDMFCKETTTTCSYGYLCESPGNICAAQPPVGELVITPSKVRKGGTATITWPTLDNVVSCTITGSNGSSQVITYNTGTGVWSPSSISTGTLNNEVTYSLSCASLDGSPNLTHQATVSIIPSIEQI